MKLLVRTVILLGLDAIKYGIAEFYKLKNTVFIPSYFYREHNRVLSVIDFPFDYRVGVVSDIGGCWNKLIYGFPFIKTNLYFGRFICTLYKRKGIFKLFTERNCHVGLNC